MSTNNTSSSGYVTEFNRETGLGVIEDDGTKRLAVFRSSSFKGRSKRYFKADNQYIGELFDFDIVIKSKDNDGDTDVFEAVNLRHRVLKCNVEGCSRLKAFTNTKALQEHMIIRHSPKEQKENKPQSSTVSAQKPKKVVHKRPEPIVISLFCYKATTASVIGRFIGKQGVNLKRLQQQNRVKIQFLDGAKSPNSVQIRIIPSASATVDMKSITKSLKFEWERCVYGQHLCDEMYRRRMELHDLLKTVVIPEIEGDSRYKDNSRFSYVRRLNRQECLNRRKVRQSESSVRLQERHSSLNQEGHRSIATCASEYRQKSIFNYCQPKKAKKSMKEAQWLINEQLQDLELRVA